MPPQGDLRIPIKIKVLMVTDNTDLLDEESLFRGRILELASLAGELHILLLNTRSRITTPHTIGNNIWIYPTNSFSPIFFPLDMMRVVQSQMTWKGRLHADLITTNDPYWIGFCAHLIARYYKKRLQINLETDITKASFFKKQFAKIVIKNAVGIRVVSNEIQQQLLSFNKNLAHKITMLPMFLDVDRITRLPISIDLHKKYPYFTFIILMYGKLEPSKNIPLAIDIVATLTKSFSRLGLVIVGKGSEKAYLMRYAKRKGIPANVIFEDDSPDIYSYYKTANMVLVTSKTEDNGMTSLEALACSCPVITSNAGVAAPILHDMRGVSFVCDRGDEQCFVQKIREFINAPGLREHFKLNALYYAKEALGYDKEEYLRRYYTTWESCFHEAR
jgi:glycosyltransferase involved in cell wall biosynthesis